MLTDHLAMHIGDLVSIDTLFPSYRKWILDKARFASVSEELESISATAAVEQRLFTPKEGDPVGRFGRMADAFDVSTAMPLAIYMATEPTIAPRLGEAFEALESYILRRDICGLTTKNYNRFFVALITRLRECEQDKVDELISYLSARTADLDRWPDDAEWRRGWLFRPQYGPARQPRLRYIFEAIERAKYTSLTEDIVIRSALTIEHIMPQKWQANWPLPGMEGLAPEEYDQELAAQVRARAAAVDVMGNLTLMTQALNSTVSHGPFSEKMPAVRANAALALNRELAAYDHWDEGTIQERGEALFEVAQSLWKAPDRADIPDAGAGSAKAWSVLPTPTPPDGTHCRFTYMGTEYRAIVVDGAFIVDGKEGKHSSFSAASRAVTGNSRNGWVDWSLCLDDGSWILADEWRKGVQTSPDLRQRRDAFWNAYVERDPATSSDRVTGHGGSARWREVSGTDFVISRYRSADSVGLFLRGDFGISFSSILPRLEHAATELQSALGVELGKPDFAFIKKRDLTNGDADEVAAAVDWLIAETERYTQAAAAILSH